jgi:hypothetical protein
MRPATAIIGYEGKAAWRLEFHSRPEGITDSKPN